MRAAQSGKHGEARRLAKSVDKAGPRGHLALYVARPPTRAAYADYRDLGRRIETVDEVGTPIAEVWAALDDIATIRVPFGVEGTSPQKHRVGFALGHTIFTADDKSKVYGADDPELTYTPSGTLHYSDT